MGRFEDAVFLLNEALPIARSQGDPGLQAQALYSLGRAYVEQGCPQDSLPLLNEALVLFTEVKRPIGEAIVLAELMAVFRDLGLVDLAIVCGKAAVNHYQGDTIGCPQHWKGRPSEELSAFQGADLPGSRGSAHLGGPSLGGAASPGYAQGGRYRPVHSRQPARVGRLDDPLDRLHPREAALEERYRGKRLARSPRSGGSVESWPPKSPWRLRINAGSKS